MRTFRFVEPPAPHEMGRVYSELTSLGYLLHALKLFETGNTNVDESGMTDEEAGHYYMSFVA